MSATPIDRWMQGYLKAWASDKTEDVIALFTEDARYYSEPYAEPWIGREEIAREWIARGDSGREWSFTYETLATSDDLAIVQGHTHYEPVVEPKPEPAADYENLWLVRLTPEGRAREFTEWWMKTRAIPSAEAATSGDVS